ncbi:hypothetical protein GCM10022222_18210 [Amycolatopsis ultiminotia]|uniref:Uncharacterized protein n=1 Tax=Amycolatopsis ultiminotia TaxID=543629 RepID=A0ABP6VL07_9PSEU
MAHLADRIPATLGIPADSYDVDLRRCGWNAVLGDADPDPTPAREVGGVFCATAEDQQTAIAKFANPHLLRHPLPGAGSVPSRSFMSSPPGWSAATLYSFVLQHAVRVDDPTELFRTTLDEVR